MSSLQLFSYSGQEVPRQLIVGELTRGGVDLLDSFVFR